MTVDAPSSPDRIRWIDAAKGLAIVLMFYGHFVQRGIDPANVSATEQLRFIYSFHMPFFFCVSGFFFRPTGRPLSRAWILCLRRLLPVAFFALLLAPLWIYGERHDLPFFWRDASIIAKDYAGGRPDLDWVTWFLVCLLMCELLALACLSRIRSAGLQVVCGLACIAFGVYFSNHSLDLNREPLYELGRFWFLSEAIVALGFYSIGHACFPLLARMGAHRRIAVFVALLGLAAVVVTFRLNSVPNPQNVVMMAARANGNAFYFAVTALAGSLAVAGLGVMLQNLGWLRAVGRNSLPLVGLNGVFFHYVDPKFVHLWPIADSEIAVTIDSLVVTALSLLVCIPAVMLLDRYVPQLIGKSNAEGPWLHSLERSSRIHQVTR